MMQRQGKVILSGPGFFYCRGTVFKVMMKMAALSYYGAIDYTTGQCMLERTSGTHPQSPSYPCWCSFALCLQIVSRGNRGFENTCLAVM